ncbi:hypothetical protein ABVV53_01710 [Novosphingobium sp. RD2P27]|uniref:Uncharacterized protein n=1 Tax=Novosphingobium kalidii TaxID=3230299 RepID=A0ABV2CXK5_9SPHN
MSMASAISWRGTKCGQQEYTATLVAYSREKLKLPTDENMQVLRPLPLPEHLRSRRASQQLRGVEQILNIPALQRCEKWNASDLSSLNSELSCCHGCPRLRSQWGR